MTNLSNPNLKFEIPSSIETHKIIKGLYPYKLASNDINQKGVTSAYFKKGYSPKEYYIIDNLPYLDNLEYILYNNKIHIYFPDYSYEKSNSIYQKENLEGKITYNIELEINNKITTYSSLTPIIEVPYYPFLNYKISGYLSYQYATNYKSNYFTLLL